MQKPIRRAAVQKLRITPQFVDEMQVHNISTLSAMGRGFQTQVAGILFLYKIF